MKQPTNVTDRDPEFMLGWRGGQVVLQPAAARLSAAGVAVASTLISGDSGAPLNRAVAAAEAQPVPDPRRRAGAGISAATVSATTDYLDPVFSRRIVISLDIANTNSSVLAQGGMALTLMPAAPAAGMRFDEPSSKFYNATSQSSNALAVITIKEA